MCWMERSLKLAFLLFSLEKLVLLKFLSYFFILCRCKRAAHTEGETRGSLSVVWKPDLGCELALNACCGYFSVSVSLQTGWVVVWFADRRLVLRPDCGEAHNQDQCCSSAAPTGVCMNLQTSEKLRRSIVEFKWFRKYIFKLTIYIFLHKYIE